MKSFGISAGLALAATASYSGGYNDANLAPGGTTGHYGNQYGHGGFDDHDHHDHIYGYDSIPADYDIDTADNETLRDAIVTAIEAAQRDRLDYLEDVFRRREGRLEQVKKMNLIKIKAPFEY